MQGHVDPNFQGAGPRAPVGPGGLMHHWQPSLVLPTDPACFTMSTPHLQQSCNVVFVAQYGMRDMIKMRQPVIMAGLAGASPHLVPSGPMQVEMPPQQGGYPQQGDYQQQGGYPPQQGGYPPQQQQGGYPPQQQGGYPQQGGYGGGY